MHYYTHIFPSPKGHQSWERLASIEHNATWGWKFFWCS